MVLKYYRRIYYFSHDVIWPLKKITSTKQRLTKDMSEYDVSNKNNFKSNNNKDIFNKKNLNASLV